MNTPNLFSSLVHNKFGGDVLKPLVTSHLANRLTQPPRSQAAAQAKVEPEPPEIDAQDSWSRDHADSQDQVNKNHLSPGVQ